MKQKTFMTSLCTELIAHKVYNGIFIASVVILLARIPLGTFNDSSILDTIAHFVLPATGTPVLYQALEKSKHLPSATYGSKLFIMVLLGVTLAVVWEIFELSVDMLFGTNWQLNNIDTMTDLMLGLAGSMLGSLIYLHLSERT